MSYVEPCLVAHDAAHLPVPKDRIWLSAAAADIVPRTARQQASIDWEVCGFSTGAQNLPLLRREHDVRAGSTVLGVTSVRVGGVKPCPCLHPHAFARAALGVLVPRPVGWRLRPTSIAGGSGYAARPMGSVGAQTHEDTHGVDYPQGLVHVRPRRVFVLAGSSPSWAASSTFARVAGPYAAGTVWDETQGKAAPAPCHTSIPTRVAVGRRGALTFPRPGHTAFGRGKRLPALPGAASCDVYSAPGLGLLRAAHAV
ncbi:hypothetical protein DFH09DRAFT_1087301 [Mycena vulgaris]|nr:hypothetical protein DFH09DRAFT_1087301 [Mycena vulgaris]